ncbi:MAG TPA: LPS export ABC transporter periplasmic protein LptC [Steroidobacteraceae bacterium]|nr:LPS export ABC transporter periplasmic protein LptC [Steroidobacteraceae bacterium]
MRPAAQRADQLKRGLLFAAATVAGFALLYGLLRGRENDNGEATQVEETRGYYLDDAVLSEMGEDGAPRIVLHAKTIEQQLSDQSVLMTDLNLDYSAPRSGKWNLTARRGRMLPDRRTLLLNGNVLVTGDRQHGSAVMNTETVTYDIHDNTLHTAAPVALQFGAHRLNGQGLHADLNSGAVQLESNVYGRFNP